MTSTGRRSILLALLVACLAGCLLLYWLKVRPYGTALRIVRSSRGYVVPDRVLAPRYLVVINAQISPESLRTVLAALPVKSLVLQNWQVADELWPVVAKERTIVDVDIQYSERPALPPRIEVLAQLPLLRAVGLCNCPVNRSGIEALAKRNLDELRLTKAEIEKDALVPLAAMSAVRIVNLSESTFSDSVVVAQILSQLHQLSELDVSNTPLSGDQILGLIDGLNLEWLVVSADQVTDAQASAIRARGRVRSLKIEDRPK